MALKVIGAGFGRTGTMSMKAALERLGFVKTHHMVEVIPNPQQMEYWLKIARGGRPGWDKVFDGFEASVDFPSCVYYRELMALYPDAKVVLTVRSADSWYDSARDTIYAVGKSTPRWLEAISPRARRMREMADGIIWDGVFKGRFEDEAFAKQVYLDHIDAVKAAVPADKLLVFEVKEGWGPLCAFLGLDAPDEPFPRVNDKAEFQKMVARMKRVATLGPIAAGAAAVAAAVLLWTFLA